MDLMRQNLQQLLDKGDPGDWLGVFECEALDSHWLGLRFAMLFDKSDFDKVTIGKTHAPDTKLGLGWRFILKAKCLTVDEAMVWFAPEEDE